MVFNYNRWTTFLNVWFSNTLKIKSLYNFVRIFYLNTPISNVKISFAMSALNNDYYYLSCLSKMTYPNIRL